MLPFISIILFIRSFQIAEGFTQGIVTSRTSAYSDPIKNDGKDTTVMFESSSEGFDSSDDDQRVEEKNELHSSLSSLFRTASGGSNNKRNISSPDIIDNTQEFPYQEQQSSYLEQQQQIQSQGDNTEEWDEEDVVDGVLLSPDEYREYSQTFSFPSLKQRQMDERVLSPEELREKVFKNEPGFVPSIETNDVDKINTKDNNIAFDKLKQEKGLFGKNAKQRKQEMYLKRQEKTMKILQQNMDDFNKERLKRVGEESNILPQETVGSTSGNKSKDSQPSTSTSDKKLRCKSCGAPLYLSNEIETRICHICHARKFEFTRGAAVTRGEDFYSFFPPHEDDNDYDFSNRRKKQKRDKAQNPEDQLTERERRELQYKSNQNNSDREIKYRKLMEKRKQYWDRRKETADKFHDQRTTRNGNIVTTMKKRATKSNKPKETNLESSSQNQETKSNQLQTSPLTRNSTLDDTSKSTTVVSGKQKSDIVLQLKQYDNKIRQLQLEVQKYRQLYLKTRKELKNLKQQNSGNINEEDDEWVEMCDPDTGDVFYWNPRTEKKRKY